MLHSRVAESLIRVIEQEQDETACEKTFGNSLQP